MLAHRHRLGYTKRLRLLASRLFALPDPTRIFFWHHHFPARQSGRARFRATFLAPKYAHARAPSHARRAAQQSGSQTVRELPHRLFQTPPDNFLISTIFIQTTRAYAAEHIFFSAQVCSCAHASPHAHDVTPRSRLTDNARPKNIHPAT